MTASISIDILGSAIPLLLALGIGGVLAWFAEPRRRNKEQQND